jgi:hypothetical protein
MTFAFAQYILSLKNNGNTLLIEEINNRINPNKRKQ